MPSDLEIPFDRITYRAGQLLTARDRRDEERRHGRLRRLHTRYLHETWGISLGFIVHKMGDNKAVIVGPGYAVDGAGRDILLAEGIQVPVPEATGSETFVLVASYQEDAAFQGRPDAAALCLSGGLDTRHERPIFSWHPPDAVRFGPQVPLVQVIVQNGTIQGRLDLRVRRNARPLIRPHMGCGVTEPGRTGWRLWEEQGQDDALGLEVVVNTSEIGFTNTPYYFAALHGDFGNRDGEPLFESDAWPSGTAPAFFLDAFGFVTDADRESFTYRIVRTRELSFPFERAISPAEAERREWIISWLGIEPVSGCEPNLDFGRIYTLSGFSLSKDVISL
jgi:hypothetical protein